MLEGSVAVRGWSAAALLDVWERASTCAPLARPLVLLAAASGETIDALATEPLGRRAARLGELRSALAGPIVEATASCPQCGEAVELSIDVRDVWPADATEPREVVVWVGGREMRCRPITTADLEAVGSLPADDAQTALVERCVRAADGATVDAGDVSDELRLAVDAAFEEADPTADVLVELTCPACAAVWSAPFDIAEFVWDELARAAQRTLGEVDLLARAYGWRESDILGLSTWRRRRYLDLLRG